jgi:electron transport complex protein RnfE
MTISLGADFKGMLLAALPPGAFIGLGFLVALKNYIDKRMAQTAKASQPITRQPLGEAA